MPDPSSGLPDDLRRWDIAGARYFEYMPTLRRGQASEKGIACLASGQDSRVDRKLRPHAPYPGLVGVVADEPLPVGGRAGHHVEVVHVMARRGLSFARDEDGFLV